MKFRGRNVIFVALASAFAFAQLCGCGGGGGGGVSRGQPMPTPTTPGTPATTNQTGHIAGRLLFATGAARVTQRVADPFLMRIPANTPQSLEVPDTGYATPTEDVTVKIKENGQEKDVPLDAQGNFDIKDVPAGTQQLVVSENGKQVTIPITVAGNKDNNQLTLVDAAPGGQLEAETQLIHGDGKDGYKKETHADDTSDTVYEDGIRDHHTTDSYTSRDLTDDGIVDQRFLDPNDDGVPDGPIMAQGGESVNTAAPAALQINNTPPEIQELSSKDNKGKKTDTVTVGESLTLGVDVKDTDGTGVTTHWTVETADGKDVTSQFLNNPDIVAPTFSPPAGEFSKPGAYIVKTTLTDPQGLSTEKDIILSVDTPDNKAPHASIKANHTSGDAPLTVDMACDAFDKDGAIAKYCWDFDKSNGVDQTDCDDTRQSVTKTFISEGKYRVTCIVTDDKGAAGFDMRVIVVRKKNSPPVITAVTPDKTTTLPGEKIKIAVNASDPDNDKLTSALTSSGGTVSDANPNDGFIEWTAPQAPGEYIIDVTDTDPEGAAVKKTIKITVESPNAPKPPTVTAAADPASGDAPMTANLTVTATDPQGFPLVVTWDFDDSDGFQAQATGTTASVKYGGPGDYFATVKACQIPSACRAADAANCSIGSACAYDKVKISVTQPNRPPFINECTAVGDMPKTGDPIKLYVRLCDDDNDELSVNWTVTGGTLDKPNDPMPTWTLPAAPGDYSAHVTVSDGKAPPINCDTNITITENPLKKPKPPQTCGVTAGNGVALAHWNAGASTDIDHYKLVRVTGGAETVVSENIPHTTTSIQDSGLSNGTTYSYKLTAVNSQGYISDPCADDMTAQPQPEIDKPVQVGDEPGDGEYDPSTDKTFVPNEGGDTVSVIDGNTEQVVKTIPVGDRPGYVCVDSTHKLAYVTNKGSDNVSVIDETTLAVVSTITVGHGPSSCVVNPDTGEIYVGNTGGDSDDTGSGGGGGGSGGGGGGGGGDSVSIIDPVTRTVKDTLHPGDNPVVCDMASHILFVTDGPDKTISFIDTRNLELIKKINLGFMPGGCVSNPGTGEIYVPSPGDGTVIVIVPVIPDPADPPAPPDWTVEPQPIPIGGNPKCTCKVNKISNQIYITNKIKRTVTLINGATRQPERDIIIPLSSAGTCGVDTTRNKICVPNKGGGAVTLINNPLPNYVVDNVTPYIPKECDAIGKNGSVNLTWSESNYCVMVYPPPPGCIITGYLVRRGLSQSGPFTQIASLGKTAKAYTDASVSNGTKYYYEVSSTRASGNESQFCKTDATPEGEIGDVIPLPAPPADGGGKGPCCTAHDEIRNIYYIANEETSTVDVINYDTHQLIRTINLTPGTCCGDIVANHVTNKIYITNKTTNKLTVINGTDYTIEEIIDIPGLGGGGHCEINEITNEIYITNDIENELIIYNPGTGHIIKVPLPQPPGCPCDVTVNKITNEIFVTNKTTNKLTIINGTDYTVIEVVDVPGPGSPGHCVINEKTNTLYMTNETTNEMIVYNRKADRIVKHITVGVQPVCKPCAVNETSNQIYVTNEGSGTISLIDGAINSVIDTIAVGHNPISAVVNPNTNQIFVLNAGDNNLSLINNPLPSTPSDTFAPAAPAGVMASSATGGITISWSPNSESDLAYYSLYRKIDGAPAFGAPLKTTINNSFVDTTAVAGTKYNYALSAADNAANESVLSGTVSGRTDTPSEIVVGTYPFSAVANEALHRVYVTNRDSNNMSIINASTNSLISNINTGVMPLGLDINPVTGNVYVANFGGTAVQIFDSSGAFIKNVVTGGTAIAGVTVDEANGMYYVSHASLGAPFVMPFSLATDVHGAPIVTRPGSLGIAMMEPTSRSIYVANSLDGSVSIITPSGMGGTAAAPINVDSQPTDVVATAEAANTVFVSCGGTGRVAAIDNTTHSVSYITVGLTPAGMGIDKTRNLVYVADASAGVVVVIDAVAKRVIGKINVGGDPTDVAVDSVLNKIFVTLKTAGKVIVRDGL